MLEEGEYLLSHVGFSRKETAVLSLQRNDSFYEFFPIDQTITLRFNLSRRFCTGWSDITNGGRHSCPNSHTVENNYEQCAACQQRTGFNPAFYNANHVSAQQEARNLEPHKLYLAYFGKDTLKVGISHASRNNARLLEQGARHALVLDTFPTAHIARSYEARIATMSSIVETVQLRKKISLLQQAISAEEANVTLLKTRQRIEQQLQITFAKNDPLSLEKRYFTGSKPDFAMAHDCSDQDIISGNAIGMLGSLLFCEQSDASLFLPMKKYVGFKVDVSYDETPITVTPRQISLF